MMFRDTDMHKHLKGKRIRRRYLNPVILLLYAFVLFLCAIEPTLWKAAPVLSILCALLFLFLVILWVSDCFFGRILCILSEQELYFNQLTLLEKTDANKKKKGVCSGSIKYEDIKGMRYDPPKPYFRISKVTPRTPRSVILQGLDFQLVVPYGNKALIRRLERIQRELGVRTATRDIEDYTRLEYHRDGIWKRIWDRFQEKAATDVFDPDTLVTECSCCEADNCIYITVQRKNLEFTLQINAKALIMMADHNDVGCDIPLSKISNLDTLYRYMQNFISKNAS